MGYKEEPNMGIMLYIVSGDLFQQISYVQVSGHLVYSFRQLKGHIDGVDYEALEQGVGTRGA